jgi:PilZ domain
MRVQTRDVEEWLATTRDLSQGGLSLVSARPVDAGRTVRIILRSPDGEWSSLAAVVRTTPMPGADGSHRTWLVGLRIDGQADVVGLRHILSEESLA